MGLRPACDAANTLGLDLEVYRSSAIPLPFLPPPLLSVPFVR
jgi:hypothetical protein